jgi:hypothetical protein
MRLSVRAQALGEEESVSVREWEKYEQFENRFTLIELSNATS